MEEKQIQQYDLWNQKKQVLEDNRSFEKIYFKTSEVWWCSVGLNIGSECLGKGSEFRRPVIVVKKLSSDLCVAVPLTSKRKVGTWFTEVSFNGQTGCAMLYQIRTLHKKRFQRKLGKLDGENFQNIKEKLESLLELSPNHHPAEAGIEGNAPKSSQNISSNR